MNKTFFLVISLFFSCSLLSTSRGSSVPYISGDSFRAICDFSYDELEKNVDPLRVKRSDVIFVKTDFLEEFFLNVHPRILQPYILVTHNSDCHAPGDFSECLDDENLIAWFGQNVETFHFKLIPISIGIANQEWPHGNIKLIKKKSQQINNVANRNILLLMSFSTSTHPERNTVYEQFIRSPFCVCQNTSIPEYLTLLGRSKFVLSPMGNGLDCHRTWEALLFGAIPIVKTSSLDPLYDDLPVIIVDEWTEINEGFLNQKFIEFQNKTFNLDKLYFKYWQNLIEEARSNHLKSL